LIDAVDRSQAGGIPEPTLCPGCEEETRATSSLFTPTDEASFSEEALERLALEEETSSGAPSHEAASPVAGSESTNGPELTEEEKRQVEELEARDREVRTHEQAHAAAAGDAAVGGPVYEYQVGPDGNRYAVGGHVQMDLSEEKDPRDTIEKMQRVRRAANAPAEPSGADRSAAAEAARIESGARQELAEEARSEKAENAASSIL
jgi:hypothetical protein